jgi:transporter family protein
MSWQGFALASAFFAALTALFGKLGVSELNSNLATFVRTVVILLLSALVVTLRGEWARPAEVPARALVFLVLSGLATGFSWLCYYRALQLGPASRVVPVDKLSVVLAVLMALLFLGETLSWKAGVGAVLVAVGVVLMAT